METATQCEAKYQTFIRMQLVLVLVFLAVPCLSRKPSPEGENLHVEINSIFAINTLPKISKRKADFFL